MVRKNMSGSDAWAADGSMHEDRLTENLAAPVVRHSAKARRAKVRLLKANIIVLPPLIGLCLFVIIGQAQTEPASERSVSSVTLNSSPGKAAAMTAMSQWLSHDPAPLPSGRVLGWDGFTSSKVAGTKSSAGGTIEIHRFTLAAGSGDDVALYDSTVEVAVSNNGIPSVEGTPTLLPRLNGRDTSVTNADPWPGWTNSTATEAIDSAVSAWATAFTSGDPDALRLAIGDKSAKRGYIPMSGVKPGSVRVTSVASKPTGDASATAEKPGTVIARVEFNLLWNGSKAQVAQAPTVSYDVLILDAASASPRVVAWGGPGTGPGLRAYQNAVRAALVDNTRSTSTGDTQPATDEETDR